MPVEIERHLVLLGWGLARSLPLVWLVPAFGGPAVPVQARLALGVALAGLCVPTLSGHLPTGLGLLWTVLLAREVLVGFAMGFICACWFRAAEAAGRLTDVLRGADFAGVISPASGGRSSPFAALMLFVAVIVFLELGGIGQLAMALAHSYEAIPLTAGLRLEAQPHAAATAAVMASARLFEATLGLCAPIVVSLLLADLALGFMGRAVPQMSIYSLGAPLKALLAIGVFLLGLGGIHAAMQRSLGGFLAILRAATHLGH